MSKKDGGQIHEIPRNLLKIEGFQNLVNKYLSICPQFLRLIKIQNAKNQRQIMQKRRKAATHKEKSRKLKDDRKREGLRFICSK
jgi:uncharacterized protein (UPF0262 family)